MKALKTGSSAGVQKGGKHYTNILELAICKTLVFFFCTICKTLAKLCSTSSYIIIQVVQNETM